MATDSVLNLLVLSNVDVEVGDQTILVDFSLQVQPGMLVELRGANGAGKTTLLKYMAGIRRVNRGRIDCDDDGLVYLGQKLGGSASLTVLEHLRWVIRIAESEVDDQALMATVRELGLRSQRNKLLSTLSAGQARRAVLAALKVVKSKLWLLDEPLTSLDDSGASWLKAMITNHREQGGAAIVATHTSLGLADTQTVSLSTS